MIMKLQNAIERILTENNFEKQSLYIYLFGSAVNNIECHDIDLLIVYNDIEYKRILMLRQKLYDRLSCLFQKEIDIVLLTENEAYITKFIEEEKCELLI